MERTLTGLLLALWLSPVITPDIAPDTLGRLRSYNQGQEDAQAGFITSGDKYQNDYDDGYRQGQQANPAPPTYNYQTGEQE